MPFASCDLRFRIVGIVESLRAAVAKKLPVDMRDNGAAIAACITNHDAAQTSTGLIILAYTAANRNLARRA